MAQFRKLLLAIDLSPLSELLIQRVREVCGDEMDHLYVIHVVTEGLHSIGEVDEDLSSVDAHRQHLLDQRTHRVHEFLLRAELDIPAERILLVLGEPACEIKKMANQIDADLVIVGSHVKNNDWIQLPGATTNCVIQGISSDVMAVKV